MAFAVGAAGAVDGAGIMAVADVTERAVLGPRGAVRQAEASRGVAALPSPCLLVVGPVRADGTEVFLVTVIDLEEEDGSEPEDKRSCEAAWTRTDSEISR